MFDRLEETIVGISTPGFGSIRGIVRASGGSALSITRRLFNPELPDLPHGGRAVVTGVCEGPGGTSISCRCLLMRAPRSYTCEDVAELHVPGAVPLLEHLCRRFIELGARSAEAGEFTFRAFWNGRLDLSQAEAVCDIIDAADETMFRRAQRSLSGRFGGSVAECRTRLTVLRAQLEAEMNWPEEDDVRFHLRPVSQKLLRDVRSAISEWTVEAPADERTIRLVLAGYANAGKSTLFNALAGGDRALVHETPGTTSDAVTAELRIDDVVCTLVDTAGMQKSVEGVIGEMAATVRDRELTSADLVIGVVDLGSPDLEKAIASVAALPSLCLTVGTKLDLADPRTVDRCRERGLVAVCSPDGRGLDRLREALKRCIDRTQAGGEGSLNSRQREAALRAQSALKAAEAHIDQGELCALEIKTAEDALAAITGENADDTLLATIFSRFCIGK